MYLDEFSVYLNDIEFKVMSTFKIKHGEPADFKIDTINPLDWSFPHRTITHVIEKLRPDLMYRAKLEATNCGYERAQEISEALKNE